ncbi:MAG: 4Fe-4S binding protein [Candidatus Thorarchaeota archaeon]
MAEDADRSESIEQDEEQSTTSNETEMAEDLPEEVKEPKERKITNPLGLILNIRMLRRVIQIIFFLGINGYIFAALWGQDAITQFWVGFRDLLPTLPIIAPLEASFGVIAGSFDVMQREFTSGIFPFFTIGAMVIILTILGRSACGWVCPIGTIQDFASLPNRTKMRPSPNTEKELRRLKAYILVLVMFFTVWVSISMVLGTSEALKRAMNIFADAAFDPFNPAYILFVILPSQEWPSSIQNIWVLGTWQTIVWLQLAFIVLLVLVSFWFPRWFCRWICPAAWFYGLFSRDALLGIGRNPARCTPDVCNRCEVVCPMNIRIRRFPYQHVHSADCIMCLDCKSHCPNNAIEVRFL